MRANRLTSARQVLESLRQSQEKIKNMLGDLYDGQRWQITSSLQLFLLLQDVAVDQDILDSLSSFDSMLTEIDGIQTRLAAEIPHVFDVSLVWKLLSLLAFVSTAQYTASTNHDY